MEFNELFECLGSCLFTKSGKFWAIISSNSLLLFLSSLPLGFSSCVLICLLLFHRCPKLYSFSSTLYSFYSLGWIISINLSLLILSFTSSNLAVNPYSEFFTSAIVLFSSRICALAPFYIFYLFIDITYLFTHQSPGLFYLFAHSFQELFEHI